MKKWFLLLAGMLLSGTANGQPALRVKGLKPDLGREPNVALRSRTPGRSHWLIQFSRNPARADLEQLKSRGVTLLSYIPDFGFSVSAKDIESVAGLDIHRIHRLRPDEKISAEFDGKPGRRFYAVVEFYRDVEKSDARVIANDAGLEMVENADLLGDQLLVRGGWEQLMFLAGWDEVSYVFPASQDLIHGASVHACAGALTSQGTVSQAIPLVGDGWDGPGLGAANLNYVFNNVTAKLPGDSAKSEVIRAFDEWAKYVQVSFLPSQNPFGSQTVAVLFATGAHGDGYPFQGTSVLAHTFYPFPVNREPIAGNMHFNDAQTWQMGFGTDLFSVALHETGHALGLGHSDHPGDVMYPFYRMHTGLMPNDIAAVQELYAATSVASNPSPPADPAPPSSPLVLAIVEPPSVSTSSPISLSGSTSGGSGAVQVTWISGVSSGPAQGSSSWLIPSIPLSAGDNIIRVTATDSLNNSVASSVTVTYQAPSAPPGDPNPPPAGPDTTPPSLTILWPATNNYVTTASSLVLAGNASDNVGVVSVTWITSDGTSGTATGTTNWSTPAIPLYVGATTIVISASDAGGNTSWRSVTVTRN